jgi:hypothetical protein
MSEDPCAAEREAYFRALQEWQAASETARKWVGTKPLDPNRVSAKPPQFIEDMRKAYDREEQALEAYLAANNALYDCQDKNNLLDID